jgi:hypothetical protein
MKKTIKNHVIASPKNFRCIEKTIKNLTVKRQSVAPLGFQDDEKNGGFSNSLSFYSPEVYSILG